jgi:hypothetical protein
MIVRNLILPFQFLNQISDFGLVTGVTVVHWPRLSTSDYPQ